MIKSLIKMAIAGAVAAVTAKVVTDILNAASEETVINIDDIQASQLGTIADEEVVVVETEAATEE